MKNKPMDHISKFLSKRHGIFTKNFTIFFSNAGKTGNVPDLNLIDSIRPSFGDDMNVTTSALDLKQFYIFYELYPIKTNIFIHTYCIFGIDI